MNFIRSVWHIFNVRAGEIVCVAGIDGNGQSELIYGITGLEKPTGGTIKLEGKDITNAPIRERSKAGMSHIPEDRHKHGLVLDYTLADNMVLQRYWQPEFQNHGFIKKGACLLYTSRRRAGNRRVLREQLRRDPERRHRRYPDPQRRAERRPACQRQGCGHPLSLIHI